MYDIAIVGGGINGVGIAVDAAGRGLKVLLVEQQDLASATSSWSSKLIHGGLRYLEHYEFRLVREALAEREVLLKKAPHIIEPLKFILPHHPTMRPTWMLKAGLLMYDNLNLNPFKRSSLAKSKSVDLKKWPENPLMQQFTNGFSYSDCFVDDSRLVALNAMHAHQLGADIRTYSQCVSAKTNQKTNTWTLELQATPYRSDVDNNPAAFEQVAAKVLVNAAGPWVQSFLEKNVARKSPRQIRLIKGSHILIPSLHTGKEAFILQNDDGRVVFVTPYRGMSLVGTTDRHHTGKPDQIKIDDYEIEYLLKTVNQYFMAKRTRADILFTYSGVRPLCDDESDDPSAITRDYTLTMEHINTAPLLTVFGGKLTTFRKLAESALDKLQSHCPQMTSEWTANTPLPGGDMSQAEVKARLIDNYAWLPASLIERFVTSYGSLSFTILGKASQIADLGQHIWQDLYGLEIDYLVQHEFAKTANDILWRRSKIGYTLKPEEKAAVKNNITALIARHEIPSSANVG